jgi:hypothetical protein
MARGAALLSVLAALARPLAAQRLQSPEFRLEPGVRTVDAFADPTGIDAASGFAVRFETVIPTSWRHVALVVGASFTPFGLSGGQRTANDPILFYGASIPLLRPPRTDGWLSLTLPILGVYQFDATGRGNDRLYEHDLVVEAAARVHLGRKLLADLGPFWSRLDAYVLVDQTLTPDRELATGRRDWFNPAFTYGVSIPLAGGARERD